MLVRIMEQDGEVLGSPDRFNTPASTARHFIDELQMVTATNRDERPFEAPFYWAPFYWSGRAV